jgi:hypothetical protein
MITNMEIGSKEELAFVIGPKINQEQQEVDIWVSNVLITHFDHLVYLPHFINSLNCEASDIDSGKIDSDYIFFNLGPTTDDVSARATIRGDNINIVCDLTESDININRLIHLTAKTNTIVKLYRDTVEALRNRKS